jgi:prepilin-type N-terminal cleavage/methylation domain-containing protein
MKKGRILNDAGFSLIELIVAILIMAIVGGAAIGAFNAVLSTKTNAAAKTVQDSLKQTRIAAMGKENTEVESSDLGGIRTNIYAKFYISNGSLYVDVCSDKSGAEVVLNNSTIGSDKYTVDFCNASGSSIATLGSSTSDMTVYVYFKKSTGGVSRLYYTRPGTSGKTNGCEMIKVISPSGETVDIILVTITGRSYIDK